MTIYIINGKEYKGRLADLKGTALYDNNCKAVYIKGNNQHHWRYNSDTRKWYLANN